MSVDSTSKRRFNVDTRWSDADSIQQQYEALRAWLIRDAERGWRQVRGVDLGLPPTTPDFERLAADVRNAVSSAGAELGIHPDPVVARLEAGRPCQIDQSLAAQYQAYYEAVVAPRVERDPSAEPPSPASATLEIDADAAQRLTPYAILATGSDGSFVERVLPGREIHSSWRWAEAQFDNTEWIRDFHVEAHGSGKGWISIGIPDCDKVTYVEVTWLFFWVPKYLAGETPANILAEKKTYNWTCEPRIDFLGSVHVHAWDTWTTSKEAGARLSISLQLVPVPILTIGPGGVPILANSVSAEKVILYENSQNIFKLTPLDATYDFGCAFSPNPAEKFKPHWIAVRTSAWGWARGDGSHVVMDFDSGNNSVFLKYMKIWEEDV